MHIITNVVADNYTSEMHNVYSIYNFSKIIVIAKCETWNSCKCIDCKYFTPRLQENCILFLLLV